MADRMFIPHGGTLEVDVKQIYVNISVGATGAPTLNSNPGSKGVLSVVRNSAGKYTITLTDAYQALLWGTASILDATNSDPTTVGVLSKLASETVSATVPTVVVQFFDAVSPFTAADPRNGAKILVCLHLRNSTVT